MFALFSIFSFILGSVVGSFLNVVIYRLPLDLSVNQPRRSFCPHCKKQIPFYLNLPLISWLQLRGKCAFCKAPIAFRYFFVELLTGLIFLAIWLHAEASNQLLLAFPLWVLASLLISATFIDFDHFIIPDEITLGGTVAGLVFSLIFPGLHGESAFLMGLLWAAVGAILGAGLLWGVVEAGKLAFGRTKQTFDPPTPFTWTRHGDDAEFVAGDEKLLWSEIFSRESDLLIMNASEVKIDGKHAEGREFRFFYNRILLPGDAPAGKRRLPKDAGTRLETLDTITGIVSRMVIPREAMGMGDVKFIACIGAFLGWKAVLFTIVAASVFGSVVGVTLACIGRRDASGRIPFGPYLALGAILWIFIGPQVIDWYFGLLAPVEAPLRP